AGHAVELRINAEDPKRFLPGPGKVSTWVEPTGPGVRVDAGYAAGTTVTPYYDSLMAKLVVHGADRSEALARAREAVAAFEIAGRRRCRATARRCHRRAPGGGSGAGGRKWDDRVGGATWVSCRPASASGRSARATGCRTRPRSRPRTRSACSTR